MSLPDFVEKRVQTIHERTGISRDEILRDYNDLFNDPFIKEDSQFKTDDERHRYAVAVLWTRYVSRPPTEEMEIIPVGMEGARITRAGNPMCNTFVFVKTKNGVEFKRLVLQGEGAVEKRKEIVFGCKYNTKLGRFESGDLVGDDRARFDDPVKLKISPQQLLEKTGAKRITIAQASKFPSRIGSDGYTIMTDWRVFRGIIVGEKTGKRDDGTEWGLYRVADDTVNAEPRVAPDGTVIRPGIACWIAPELMKYAIESECDFAGTISLDRESKEPSMSCFMVVPVHVRHKT